MIKSILVIDMPKNCENCPFCRGWNVCKIMKYLKKEKIISVYTVDRQIFEGGKPDWCPLQDLPKRKMLLGLDGASNAMEIRERGRQEGFNACIDEILKGANRNE